MSNIRTGSVFLDRFHIMRRLGSGSYGRVYEALDLFNGDRLAIKLSSADKYNRERNIIESQILETLNNFDSPSRNLVVEMKMCIVLEDCVAIVLELLSHSFLTSLEMNVIQDHTMILKYARQMVECLNFISQAGVIHGDIKPENILHELKGDGIKFADFGLSHSSIVKEKAKDIQTIYYMAPEVILGYDYDSAVDTWSVGCVLFECLTKKMLFRVKNEMELLYRMVQIIGTLDQDIINHAPKRDRYFQYDPDAKMWVLVGLRDQIASMGLRSHLQSYYSVDVDDPECRALIDLIEGMLRLNPLERYTPEECLAHPYFRNRGEEDRPTSCSNKLAGLRRMCTKMNLPNDLLKEALGLYKEVKFEQELVDRNQVVVVMSCIYIQCFKRKIVRSLKDFVEASGINGVISLYMAKTVRQITNMLGTSKRTKITKHCLFLGLTGTVAGKATRIVDRITAGKGIVRCSNMASITAAAIFIAATGKGCKISTEAVAQVTGAQGRSVIRCLKQVIPHARYLLSP